MNGKGSCENHFDFLKGGKDVDFDKAMKSMDNLYDDMFGDSDKYDQLFNTFNTEKNPITQSIDQMSKQVFGLEEPKVDQKYIKVEVNGPPKNQKYSQYQEESQEQIFIGEPVYMNNNSSSQQLGGSMNAYGSNPYFQENYKK